MALPRRILLVRHGQSLGNVDKSVYGTFPDHAIPLTEAGRVQAIHLGRTFGERFAGETVRAYVSPYRRARETAGVAMTGMIRVRFTKMTEDWRLREQDWGNLREPEATAVLERQRESYGSTFYRFPNGESGADVYDRVSDFMSTLWRDFEKDDFAENVLIFTHGFTMRVFLARWFHWTPAEFESVSNPENCGVFEMERTSGVSPRYRLVTALGDRFSARHPQTASRAADPG